MFDWINRLFGKGSKADRLIRALPNPSTLLARGDAWAATLVEWGDRIAAWEPAESRLLQVIKDGADALDLVGPMLGASGAEKLAALKSKVQLAALAIGVADETIDRAWVAKLRPILESYLARAK